jgi:hypothetical protein
MNSNENRLLAVKDLIASRAAAQFDIRGVALCFSRTIHPGSLTGALGIYNECRCHARILLAALKKRLQTSSGLIPAPKIDFAVNRSRSSFFGLSDLYLKEVVAEARTDDNPEHAVQNRIFADHLKKNEQSNPALENLGETILCDGISWIRIFWMATMSAAACDKDVKAPALSVGVLGYLLAQHCLESTADAARTETEAARKALESALNDLPGPPNGSRLNPGDLRVAVKFLFH